MSKFYRLLVAFISFKLEYLKELLYRWVYNVYSKEKRGNTANFQLLSRSLLIDKWALVVPGNLPFYSAALRLKSKNITCCLACFLVVRMTYGTRMCQCSLVVVVIILQYIKPWCLVTGGLNKNPSLDSSKFTVIQTTKSNRLLVRNYVTAQLNW